MSGPAQAAPPVDDSGNAGTAALDASEGSPPAPIIPTPKVDQVGYLPDARKIFILVASSAGPGDRFTVNDAASGAEVLAGSVGGPVVDDTASSGEHLLHGDFSDLSKPGRYVVAVNGQTSPPFEIGEHVYDKLFRDALRAFYLIRCGVAIDDSETGVAHAACHQADAVLRDDPATSLDLLGGWHNAGDFGKWAHMAAISASKMMWAYELNRAGAGAFDTNIPESSNQIPDLLDEARWGLEWLLKLQRSDGSVIHKVDTEPHFAWGLPPESDPYTRTAAFASTIDAAVFTAAMAQASRVFRDLDQAFADRCLTAARSSWAWVQSNPAVGHSDPYYADGDPSQEITWALAEMSRAENDPALRARFSTIVGAGPVDAVSWQTPELLGYMAVAEDANADDALKSAVITRITELADALSARALRTGYRVAMDPAEYAWESNETLLDRAGALLFASMLSANREYRKLALEQLDWVLGRNPLDLSYVTGYGTRTVEHPYHWIPYTLHQRFPGWATGGPNQYPNGADVPLQNLQAAGTPPAKCFLDMASSAGSYASNEGETTENAALVLVTGLLVHAPDGLAADGGASPDGLAADGGASPDGLAADGGPGDEGMLAAGRGCACAETAVPRHGTPRSLLTVLALVLLSSARRRQPNRARYR